MAAGGRSRQRAGPGDLSPRRRCPHRWDAAGPDGALAGIEAGFVSALQQTFSSKGTEGAVELPHDVFIPWKREALYTRRHRDSEAGEVHRVAGADEYRLMVEHFARAGRGEGGLDVPPEDGCRNTVTLDALALAAREERTAHPRYSSG